MILSNKEPIYLSIAAEYRKYIDMGIYHYDERLPSVRALALDLGINPNTVQRSYKMLEDEGYIKTIAKKGIYVAKDITKSNTNLDTTIKKQITTFKEQNIKKEDLLQIISEVYDD